MNEGVVMGAVMGAVFFIAGMILYLFPPREINNIYGYRTSSSMRNIENWVKANKFCSRLLMIFGIIMLIFSFIFKNTIMNFTTLGVSIILIFILVEIKIAKG
ncbi:SdpI family protein [Metabacillus sp. HB246100]